MIHQKIDKITENSLHFLLPVNKSGDGNCFFKIGYHKKIEDSFGTMAKRTYPFTFQKQRNKDNRSRDDVKPGIFKKKIIRDDETNCLKSKTIH